MEDSSSNTITTKKSVKGLASPLGSYPMAETSSNI